MKGKSETKIEAIMFHDGPITSYEYEKDVLTMQLHNYLDMDITLGFQGNLRVEARGSVGSILDRQELRKVGGARRLEIMNDDLKIVFAIMFERCTVQFPLQ